jgi:HK97 family phage prohead protease
MVETIRKQFDTNISKGTGPNNRVRRFVISTGAVDRDNDTIDPAGWQLDHYRMNPVVLWAHDYNQLPLAKALSVNIEGPTLVATAEFADHLMADTVLRMIDGGFLRATSVGFKPKKAVQNVARGGYDFIEQELLEFSVVPVPANPEAVRHLKAEGLWRDTPVLKLLDTEPGVVLELADTDPVADLRRHLAEQARNGALAGLRARGYAVGGDPPIDPAERHHVEDLIRASIRGALGTVVRDAVESSIAKARGRVE